MGCCNASLDALSARTLLLNKQRSYPHLCAQAYVCTGGQSNVPHFQMVEEEVLGGQVWTEECEAMRELALQIYAEFLQHLQKYEPLIPFSYHTHLVTPNLLRLASISLPYSIPAMYSAARGGTAGGETPASWALMSITGVIPTRCDHPRHV